MPDDPSSDDQSLASKANIAKVKTTAMKKGLAKQKNIISAKKKDFISHNMQPPEELTIFLQSDSTFEEILKAAETDKHALLVRRYVYVFQHQRYHSIPITYRFLMCYLVYTNFQRQGAVANMTAMEVLAAEKSRNYRVIKVWDHKTVSTHVSARIATHVKVYQLLISFMEPKTGADLVFTTTSGDKVTHIAFELEKLGEHFGKKFSVTPTMNRKQIATSVSKAGSEADVRATASHMTHSVEIHRSTYQQKGSTDETVDRYLNVQELAHIIMFNYTGT